MVKLIIRYTKKITESSQLNLLESLSNMLKNLQSNLQEACKIYLKICN